MGLEHWHGSKVSQNNAIEFVFTPTALKSDKYRITLAISANGRGETYYVPVTLLNGAC